MDIIIYTSLLYSPDFNPIENVFSCIKAHYKKNKNIDDAFFNLSSNTIIKCINHVINNIDTVYT